MNKLWILCVALAGCDQAPSPPPVTVFAATSLKEAVTEITGTWSRQTGRPIRVQYEAASTLARQIQAGAPSDVFISATPEWLDEVRPLERFDWLSNRLVCVVRKNVTDFDLKTVESLALANEQVPVGKYARAALAHLGIKPPRRTIYGSNVRDVLAKVSQGGAVAGIVYATDAAIDPEVRIACTFPPESHPRILYSAGLLSPAGKSLYDALREPWAMEIARRHGFTDLQ